MSAPLSLPDGLTSRPLTPDDAPAFAAIAPPWALRSWGSFAALIEHGAAFGVPLGGGGGGGFASLAWTFDASHPASALCCLTRRHG